MRWTINLEGGPKRVNHAACAIGNKIYSFGGYCSAEKRHRNAPIDVHVLDTATYRWSRVFGEEVEHKQYAKRSIDDTSFMESFSDDEFYDTSMDDDEQTLGDEFDWQYNPLMHGNPEILSDEGDFKNIPYMRYGHTVVAYQNKAYLWGGRNDEFGASQKLYEYDPGSNSWMAVSVETPSPPARDGHSAVLCGHRMIIFGGFEEENQRFSQECYAFDFVTKEWKELKTTGNPPQYRDFHAACILNERMYVFGGRCDERGQFHSNADFYDDVMRYLDLKTGEWIAPEITGHTPKGRRSNTMWAYNGHIYMFGGYESKNDHHFADLSRFDPVLNIWSVLRPAGHCSPSARRRQCSVMVGNRLFMFGGTMPHPVKKNGALVDLGDLFVLDYENTLFSICVDAVVQSGFYRKFELYFPLDIRHDIEAMTTPNTVSRPSRSKMSTSG